MSIDPSFGRPFERFAPVSSFVQPVAAPTAGPLDGPLVALPCINQDWLKLLLGAAAQLENPSAWKQGISDSTTLLAVQRAQELRAALAEASECVNPVIGASLDSCVLNLHMADGSTVAVTNWAAEFGDCVRSNIPTPVPPNPQHASDDQLACDIAGFLAQEVIQKAITATVNAINTNIQLFAFASYLAQQIAFAFPLTSAFVQAAYQLYHEVQSGTLAHYTSASTDPTLVDNVACVIYNCIKTVGYIDATNYGCIAPGICSMSYTYPDVISGLCQFVSQMGLTEWQSFQIPGVLEGFDCSGCRSQWCFRWDFRSSFSGWVSHNASCGAYGQGIATSGVGYVSQYVPCLGHNAISITTTFTPGFAVDQVNIGINGSNQNTSGDHRQLAVYNPIGTQIQNITLDDFAYTGQSKITVPITPATVQEIGVYWTADGTVNGAAVIDYIEMIGHSTAPSPASPCPP